MSDKKMAKLTRNKIIKAGSDVLVEVEQTK
jgi:hypothetical protein